MFDYRDYVMQGYRDAIGKMADHQIILSSVKWQENNVLTLDDLAELQELINAKNTPPVVEEIPTEEEVTE